MKSEQQATDKLEAVIGKIGLIVEGFTPEEKENCPIEKQCELALLTGMILVLGWVLDSEEEMKPFLNAIKFAGLAEKMKTIH